MATTTTTTTETTTVTDDTVTEEVLAQSDNFADAVEATEDDDKPQKKEKRRSRSGTGLTIAENRKNLHAAIVRSMRDKEIPPMFKQAMANLVLDTGIASINVLNKIVLRDHNANRKQKKNKDTPPSNPKAGALSAAALQRRGVAPSTIIKYYEQVNRAVEELGVDPANDNSRRRATQDKKQPMDDGSDPVPKRRRTAAAKKS